MTAIMNAMRYPAEDTAERHEQILDAASQMFRQSGFDGVSVAAVMKAAGLTHGGFYAHFESKDALAAASVERSLAETLDLVERASEAAEPLATLVTEYLSEQHRDDPAGGCTMAALAAEISRANGPVRHTFTAQVRGLVERITVKFFPAQRSNERAQAIVTMSTLVGALLIARAVDDPVLSAEILAANRAHFGVEPEAGE
jgi:TetR/AcrR family transcriptional regulator, transcriptional repressor for nem operon